MERELTAPGASISTTIPQLVDPRRRYSGPGLVQKKGIVLGGCVHKCAAPPETRAGRSMRHFAVDFLDILLSPLQPGPLHGLSRIDDFQHPLMGTGASSSASTDLPDLREACSPKMASRVAQGVGALGPELLGAQMSLDRMAEFQLCVEMLRDCFDAYVEDGEHDELTSHRETLDAVEETLLRITELATSAVRRPPDMTPSLRESPQELECDHHHDGLQRCLLASGLGISGMLEAALEDLSDGLMQPGDSEHTDWQRWDELYAQLLSQCTGLDPTASRVGMTAMRCNVAENLGRELSVLVGCSPEESRFQSGRPEGDWCGSDWQSVQEAPDCVPQRCCGWSR